MSSGVLNNGKLKVEQSKLAETINYEEDKVPEGSIDRPIYESTEGPIPKQKAKMRQGSRPKTGKSGANVLLSGESFGVNPLRSIKGAMVGDSKAFERRQKIDDNFLEEEEDYASSKMSESGEIDPKLFA